MAEPLIIKSVLEKMQRESIKESDVLYAYHHGESKKMTNGGWMGIVRFESQKYEVGVMYVPNPHAGGDMIISAWKRKIVY